MDGNTVSVVGWMFEISISFWRNVLITEYAAASSLIIGYEEDNKRKEILVLTKDYAE